jgi:hypothetical protein
MQFQRLWQTLTFFEVIPFFNCLSKLFNFNREITSANRSSMNYILICDNDSNLVQETIHQLTDSQCAYRIITSAPEKFTPSGQQEIIHLDSNQDNLSPTILEGVEKIIFFPQGNIGKLIDLVKHNWKPGEIILTCFDRQNPSSNNLWGAVDDVVMGGVSSSNLILQEKTAIFTGRVSTDNNGGFVSVRTKNFQPPWNLSAYEGIRLRVKGDGQRYKFITRCEGKWDGISYCFSFDTIADVWMTIDIPFADLIPVFRAKTVSDAGKFDASKVYSLQLMLSKFEYDGAYNPTFRAGAFSLEIESIKAYGKSDSPQLIFMGDLKSWSNQNIPSQLLTIYAQSPEDL